MKKTKPRDADLPKNIADAIRQAWPDGVVDMTQNSDAGPLRDVYPRLKASLSRIRGARVLYERGTQSVPNPEKSSEAGQVSPDWDEGWRSYRLFFVSPANRRFEFDTETIEPDEDGVERRLAGQGWVGCVVGISVVAPFAAVSLDQFEVFESGSRFEPDVEPHMFSMDGGKLDLESHFREMVDDEGLSILGNLRARIVRILKDSKIAVIPEEDLDRPVPWLRAGEEALAGQAGQPITVRQAFFFQGL